MNALRQHTELPRTETMGGRAVITPDPDVDRNVETSHRLTVSLVDMLESAC